MSELLPAVEAKRVRDSITDYLTTTFGLAEPGVRDAVSEFLADPVEGMFKGPYVRLRLPFRPADEGWRESLEWYGGFPPYGHQAAAFAQLSTWGPDGEPRRPKPTLVTTGTGSGKTESFLYPILDHARRARRQGAAGTKALILYPMNALANDQALRLARLITEHPALAGITAALYTGESRPPRTQVTPDGLITDRGLIRDDPPDILLTNYKMLDQLLLRADDQGIWRKSAISLQYLVLDEFHTYDGAQGTDVAMLLRRLGLALKSHWSEADPDISDGDRTSPLGRLVPVATSATLGDRGDPAVMLDFARTVFGIEFGDDSVVTETRVNLDEWVGDAPARVAARRWVPIPTAQIAVAQLDERISPEEELSGADLTASLLPLLYEMPNASGEPELDAEELLDLVKAHPLVRALVAEAVDAVSLDELTTRAVGPLALTAPLPWRRLVELVVSVLGHVRSRVGRAAVSVDLHLWIRELTRIDRVAASSPSFVWSDDGPTVWADETEQARPSFPAVYCRHCGRSGWGVLLNTVGWSLSPDDRDIRRRHLRNEGRFRALLSAPGEAAADTTDPRPELMWFHVRGRELLPRRPDEEDRDVREGWVLPVLTAVGKDGDQDARRDTCPSCGQVDGIRFLGSAIATLLSVSLSTLFGSAVLDQNEKKALVFTDSVQDAAHRAGFVQARSHVLTLRGVLHAALGPDPITLEQLLDTTLAQAGDDPFARYRLLPPQVADVDGFAPFWRAPRQASVKPEPRRRVRSRLALDIALEFGLNSRTGRTLELTGTAAAEVDAGSREDVVRAARSVLDEQGYGVPLDAAGSVPDDARLVRWVRGVLDRLRSRGAIEHEWFERYRQEDGNRWPISGGRNRGDGMPAFPPGRPAPGYPRVGGSAVRYDSLDPVSAPQSWHARWTSRVLDVSPPDGGRLARALLERLHRDGIVTALDADSGAKTYAVPPSRVRVHAVDEAAAAAGRHRLVCDTCRATTPGTVTVVDNLVDGPCLVIGCPGTLHRSAVDASFYRSLYRSSDHRRIVAREHTSLLDDATRLSYEDGFKRSGADPQAPNVLVATPTLEMGIDIGDLSTVVLASLPRRVASYLQRVGRAGRLTGNAFDLAFVTGRGEHLPKLGDPLSVINGAVRPPATYLQAEEILRRQFTAHLIDLLARRPGHRQPRNAPAAIGRTDPGSFLATLIDLAESAPDEHVLRFTGSFDGLPEAIVGDLIDRVRAPGGPGSSRFAEDLRTASTLWQDTVAELQLRKHDLEQLLPELEAARNSPAASEDDRIAYRSALSSRKLTEARLGQLRGEHWVAVLEEYGILPNYTLLDDRVSLDVGLSWIDPDTGDYRTEHTQVQRGSALAIREFAPGSRFYARGLEIEVDAVDLGIDGAAVERRRFCPRCGYSILALGGRPAPSECPRCGSPGLADVGQELDTVHLRHVTAEVRRDQATITDASDERRVEGFEVVCTADIDPAHEETAWFASDVGLGCRFFRRIDLQWVNLGRRGSGVTWDIAGDRVTGGLFRVCRGCGKLDQEAGRNSPREHRPWCRFRNADDEHTVSVALSRRLTTQALVIELPVAVTIGDDFAVPSLAAALLLGMRERLGGHPDHLQVEHITVPASGSGAVRDALLLHDVVPGGTGYLADLADPERLWSLLAAAWAVVRSCPCRDEQRLACHRCLLPFARQHELAWVSRSSAERHLRTVLGVAGDSTVDDGSGSLSVTWELASNPASELAESHLEQRLRAVLVDRIRRTGAAITETPGPWGNTVHATLAGSAVQWRLVPQLNLLNSRPDFVLQSSNTNIPDVAIFVDGSTFHASASHNRLADDAEKRALLRQAGHVVLSVTAADITAAERGEHPVPTWWTEQHRNRAMKAFPASREAYESLRYGPVDWLLGWLTEPSVDQLGRAASGAPVFLVDGSRSVSTTDDLSPAEVALAVLDGDDLPAGPRQLRVRQDGPLVTVVELRGRAFSTALVLDDRPSAIADPEHLDAWRQWHSRANALGLQQLREEPSSSTVVTVASAFVGSVPSPATVTPGLPEPWLAVWDAAPSPAEKELAAELAGRPGVPVPEIGPEGPDGIPLEWAWPERRLAATFGGLSVIDRRDLEAAGWTVVDADADLVAAALHVDDSDSAGRR